MNNSDIDRFHQLMMGAVDGELGDKEIAEFERLLERNPDFQNEYKKYKELKEMTSKMKFK
jgi:anti-sigma factor RsiW